MKKISKISKLCEKTSAKISNYPYLSSISIFLNRFYLNAIQKFLKKNYLSLINIEPAKIKTEREYSECIWVCWFQGYENAPELVKNCINNLKNKAGRHTVIVLDESNMLDYASIPDYIVQKYKDGIITKQNFSDILRFALLSQQGGAWIDSTIWLTEALSDQLFNMDVYSIKNNKGNKYNIAARRWTAYFWICKKDSYFAQKVFQFFCDYWKENNSLIDYFLIDHIIAFLYANDPKIKSMLDAIPENNIHVSDLQKELSKPYSEENMNELKSNTSIFKLSWKVDYSGLPENATYYKLFKE